jgi:terminase small subunit / prophage DNA-packing protein
MEKDKTETVSAAELASLLLVSRKTVAEWAALGIVVRVGHGRYALRESVKGFAQHVRERDRGGDAAAVSSVAEQRARKLKLECDPLERGAGMQSGKLLDAAAMTQALSVRFRSFRDGMLRFPKTLPWLDREALARLDEEIRELLTDFADGKLGYLRKELPPNEGDHASPS